MTITSPHNETLKEIRKLAGRKWRDKLRQFVAEGEDLLEAADAAGWEPLARLVAEGSGLDGEEVKPHLLQQISQLGSGHAGDRRLRAALGRADRPAVPGAVGRQRPRQRRHRAAERAGVRRSSVALGPGTADPYGHKAVRASMGALFEVPVARVRTVEELPGRRIALVAHGGEPLAPDGDTTLVVGAEREGLPDDVVAACDAVATIPVRSESLNAAMAATVALYECNRRMAAP